MAVKGVRASIFGDFKDFAKPKDVETWPEKHGQGLLQHSPEFELLKLEVSPFLALQETLGDAIECRSSEIHIHRPTGFRMVLTNIIIYT